MNFNPKRTITKIQVPIIRVCNRRCPDCCARDELTWYNKALNKPNEVSLEELKWAGELFGELDELEITGGEPTMHSQFDQLSDNLRKYFNCKSIILVSNGWLFGKDPSKLPLLLKYDDQYITHYGKEFTEANGGAENSEAIDLVREFLRKNGKEGWVPNKPLSHIKQGNPPYPGGACGWNDSSMISYYEGNLYGCCVAWSSRCKGTPIPLTKNWREKVTEIVLPCETCFLSQ